MHGVGALGLGRESAHYTESGILDDEEEAWLRARRTKLIATADSEALDAYMIKVRILYMRSHSALRHDEKRITTLQHA